MARIVSTGGGGFYSANGAVVPLTPKVIDTLIVLVERAGQPLSKEELLRLVWPDTFVGESNLAQNISVLRKALGYSCIETLAKRGYRFAADVHRGTSQPPAALPLVNPESPPRARLSRRFALAALLGSAALCVGVVSWRYRGNPVSPPPIRSLAVLPLISLSGDPHQDYIADGITEVLTGELSKALPMRVVSRTSAMHYRNVDKPLALIAGELRVDAVVEGSVTVDGGHLRVTAQLIQAATDRHLWAETYDRELSDLPLLQEEIARAIAREIRIGRTPVSRQRVLPTTREVSEAYLRARYYLDQRTGQEIVKAVSWYHLNYAQAASAGRERDAGWTRGRLSPAW